MQRILKYQGWHALALVALFVMLSLLGRLPGFYDGGLWGVPTPVWYALAVGAVVVHQVYAGVMFRTQLETEWVTRRFPKNGFRVYMIVFMIGLASRPVTLFLLAIANRGTLPLNRVLLAAVGTALLVPFGYLGYSVARFFGFARAAGADHFDPSYRNAPLEKRGIFRYTNNGMYTVGFLIVWVPGLWFASVSALAVALFSHLYIWVHYYTIEKPDMAQIYGEPG